MTHSHITAGIHDCEPALKISTRPEWNASIVCIHCKDTTDGRSNQQYRAGKLRLCVSDKASTHPTSTEYISQRLHQRLVCSPKLATGSGLGSCTKALMALNCGYLASFMIWNNAISVVTMNAPLCDIRCSPTARSVGRCDDTPSTITCTS